MPSFDFYLDSTLTQKVTALNPLAAAQDALGTLPPVDRQVWLGSTDTGLKARANSNPGVDMITVSVVDTASGSGEPATAVKLATSQGGLAGATPGASLTLGVQVNSGSANAVSFWVRLDDAVAVVGSYTDLKLQANQLKMDPV